MNIKGTTTSTQDLAAQALAMMTTEATGYLCLGIMGEPSTGKTTNVVNTFPQPVMAIDFDKKLPEGTKSFPFHNQEWVRKNFPKETHTNDITNTRDALTTFTRTQISKLPPGGTLLVDGWSAISVEFDRVSDNEPYRQRYGDQSGYVMKYYNHKLQWSHEIFNNLKSYNGHLVVTFHEQPERNKQGVIVGVKAIASGQLADRLSGYFTAFFRAQLISDPANPRLPLFVWNVIQCDDFKAVRPQGFDLTKIPDFPNATTPSKPYKCFIRQDFAELMRCCGK